MIKSSLAMASSMLSGRESLPESLFEFWHIFCWPDVRPAQHLQAGQQHQDQSFALVGSSTGMTTMPDLDTPMRS